MKKSKNMEPNREFWRSVGEFYNGKSAIEQNMPEFPESVKAEFEVNKLNPVSRRKFMALLGASSAFALAGCNDYRDKGEIISYNNKPEYANYGDAVFFASTLNDGTGVLVKTREGRPIKLDGNPDHPIFKGKTNAQHQASIMSLYEPERVRQPLKRSGSKLILNKEDMLKTDWATCDKEIVEKLKKAVSLGKEIAIVSHSVISPTQKKLLDDFIVKYPTTQIYSYELHNDSNRRLAWKECYGIDGVPSIQWDKANIILALEADVLGTEGNVLEQMRHYSSRRNVNDIDNFNRLYVAEAGLSLTGMNADYRFRLSPEYQLEFIYMIINELMKKGKIASDKPVMGNDVKSFADKYELDAKKLNYLITDFGNNLGKSIVYAGDNLPVEIHKAVALLNELLGNNVLFNFDAMDNRFLPHITKEEGKALIEKMKSGKVSVLIHFDSNPVYHFAGGANYFKALDKVETKISFSEMYNETNAKTDYLLPINNDLESWNDFNIRTGILSLQQPIIAPLYDTRQKEAILLNWISADVNQYNHDIYHQYLMKRWEAEVYPMINPVTDFKKFWYSCLHDGVIEYTFKNPITPVFNLAELPQLKINKNGYTVILNKNYSIGDGRYANNGWLLELPHPVSKVAWDNYAAISPKTAKVLGVKNNDMIEIKANGKTLKLPVVEQPGMAEKVLVTELGYGRTHAGEVGNNVGFNTNLLVCAKGFSDWILSDAEVKKTNETYKVYSTQEHHPIDDEFVKDFHFIRDIIKEGTVEQYKKDKKFLKHHEHNIVNIQPEREYKGRKWAMAIDLNKCVSCNNCVSSCNVENNIPVVGKDQVANGREMHWIRLDRYYSGTPEEPKVSLQPMLCQHCDHAPCENVCPVVATTHSEDGLNQMTYNRCVGTRYCANNCPFKVRRFNFFDFRDHVADGHYKKDSVALAHNPEVTVRSRGVMEKCTFCVQRIMEARQEAIKEGREVKGGEFKTACQEACPADAIIFGNSNDKDSDIAKAREHDLGFHVLELLNIKPNVTYIAKLRNIYSEEA